MATQLRRSLYIGLGGTGMNTILRTKKMFMENYGGQVPPMISFLGIDTNKGEYDTTLRTKNGELVRLEGNEQCSISVENAFPSFSRLKEDGLANWMFDSNVGAIRTLNNGAGQVRTNGKLAFSLNFTSLQAALTTHINRIHDVNIINNELYEVINAAAEIHIIYSVSGGTGAGTFIDAGYLVRYICQNQGNISYNLNGYAVLPNVFKAMRPVGPEMARVRTNGYAALKDLDYLMGLDAGNAGSISMSWSNNNIKAFNQGPYDNVSIIDNTNINGEVLPHINDIAEAISLVLVSSAGSMSTNIAGVMDNVNIQRGQGIFNCRDKMGWVSSIGASEIIFNSENIANIYAHKAACRIISILTTSNGQANLKANAWIDDVSIRENNGNDHLINHIYEMKNLISMMEITQNDNPLPEVETYIKQATSRDFRTKVTDKLEVTKSSLDNLFSGLLNSGNNGIKLAEETLIEISNQLDIYICEMKNEQTEFEGKSDALTQQMNNAISDLKDASHKWFIGASKRKAECKDELYARAKNVAANKIEIARRTNAIDFFSSLKNYISTLTTKVATLSDRLTNIANNLNRQVAALQNSATENSSIVEIDLSRNIVTQVVVNDDELIIADFIESLAHGDLMSLYNSEIAESSILDFAYKLPGTTNKREKTIDDALNELSEEDFDKLFDQAVTKASPLLRINDKGYDLHSNLCKSYYICVPNVATSRLTRVPNDGSPEYYKRRIISNNPEAISTGLNDKVIIFRQEGAYPAFAIASLESFQNDYENDNMAPHFDKLVFEMMQREEHEFLPKRIDSTADALEAWVYGLIYGFIKTEDGVYMFKDWEDASVALNGNWVNTNERFRDRAFQMFSDKIKTIKDQYNQRIAEFVNTQGQAKNIELLREAKADGVYLNKFSQCTVTLATIQSRREYKPTEELLTREVLFVNNIALPN